MKNTLKQSFIARELFVLAIAVFSLGASFPSVAIGLSRSDLGQPNPQSMNGDYGTISGSGSSGGYSSGSTQNRLAGSPLSVSCASTKLNTTVGQPITWFSSVIGGIGSYAYTWNGTEGFSGNTSTITRAYATNGEKFATLSITSGNQLVTVSCGSVVVGNPAPIVQSIAFSGFGASCYATPERALPGETVTWLSIVTGTTASTTYTWDGTDGLTGDRPLISKAYTTNGIKSALLTVTNGSNRIVTACTSSASIGPRIAVTTAPKSQVAGATDIHGVCAPSSTQIRTSEPVVWTVATIGGTASNYEFLWSGDEALLGTSSTTSKTYATPGIKNASVVIASGSKTVTVTCPAVEVTKGWASGLTASSLFSWISGTVGYLLALGGAIIAGIVFARRKRAKEEEEEKDHEH